jgi:hypothetical protein
LPSDQLKYRKIKNLTPMHGSNGLEEITALEVID